MDSLLDIVKESGVVNIISDYKMQIEYSEHKEKMGKVFTELITTVYKKRQFCCECSEKTLPKNHCFCCNRPICYECCVFLNNFTQCEYYCMRCVLEDEEESHLNNYSEEDYFNDPFYNSYEEGYNAVRY